MLANSRLDIRRKFGLRPCAPVEFGTLTWHLSCAADLCGIDHTFGGNGRSSNFPGVFKLKLTSRLLFIYLIGFLLTAHAEQPSWPLRPIRLVVPSAAGGGADQVARVLAQQLTIELGKSVVIENRPGAAGLLATLAVKTAPADGYTFLLATNSTHAANRYLFRRQPYDALRDFAQVAMIGTYGSVAVVNVQSRYKSVQELISYAQQHPDKVFFGYYSSSSQVPAELLKVRAGLQISGVSYKSIQQIVMDLLGGAIDFAFVDYVTATQPISQGQLRPLAVTDAVESPVWPSVPTMSRYYPGFEVNGWFGMSAPAGTPVEVISQMNRYVSRSLHAVAVRKQLERLGLTVRVMQVDQFEAFIRADQKRWKDNIDLTGIQPQ